MAKAKGASKSKGNSRPQSSGALAQPQLAAASSNILTAFCDIVQDSQFASTSSGSNSSTSSESTSQDPHLYAQADCAVSADTVRIFNANSGNLVARWASSSESDRVKSIAWVALSQQSATQSDRPFAKQRKRKQSSSHSEGQQSTPSSVSKAGKTTYALALGLSSGQITLVNPANSAVITTLSHPSGASPVTSLSFPSLPQELSSQASTSLLWSCGADGQISLWGLPDAAGSGGRLVATYKGAGAGWSTMQVTYQSPMAGNADSTVTKDSFRVEMLVAQHAIKCYTIDLPLSCLNSQTQSASTFSLDAVLAATCTGHTTNVKQMTWLKPSKGGMRFLSIAEGDRYVNNWAARPDNGSTEGRLQATLSLDEPVVQVVISPRRDAALVITTSGATELVLFWPETQSSPVEAKKKAKMPVASLPRTTSIICQSANNELITSARFLRADASILRVSRGIVRPSFESILPRNADGTFRPEISLNRNLDTATSTQPMNSKTGKPATYSEHIQSAVIGGEPSTSKPVTVNGKTASTGDADPNLAERIKRMGFESTNDERTFDTILSQAEDLARRQRRALTKGASREAQSASISQSLVQALHSSDVKLLESCLQNKDVNVIRASVKRIPNHLVILLVNALVERISRKKAGTQAGSGGLDAFQGQRLVFWLRTVLLYHLPYLITLPDLVAQLSSLHAMLESRMAFHDQLLSLNGRLDLVVAQIELKASNTKASAEIAPQEKVSTGTAKYVEGEESSESSDEDSGAADEQESEGEEDVEDLVLDPRTSMNEHVGSLNGMLEGDELHDEDDDDDEIPAPPKKKKNGLSGKPRVNGFVDIEAEESEDEGSDLEASLRKTIPNGFAEHEEEGDEDDDDAEDLDAYESDFINDDSEEQSGEDSEED